jgi:hypothetical protein
VLRASIEPGLEAMTIGLTIVKPHLYNVILKGAHPRVFNLAQRIKDSAPMLSRDEEMEYVLGEPNLEDMFTETSSSGDSLVV